MITNNSFSDLESKLNENGLVMSSGKPAVQKFTGEAQGLGEGDYTPLIAGGMPANEQVSRQGRPFSALAYKNAKGATIHIGLRGIASPIMILDKPTDATKWDGKASAHSFFRFGKLSDIGLPANQKTITNGVKATTLYDAQAFKLAKRVQYIVPKFVEEVRDNGQQVRRPVYEAGCEIRSAWAVADYDQYAAAGNNTSLPVAD